MPFINILLSNDGSPNDYLYFLFLFYFLDAHGWLRCLADNTLTARASEGILTQLFKGLDGERERSLVSLQVGLEAYSEQHNALLGAIRAFQDRILAYKQDFVQREVLVLRGFLQYLLGTLSNELSQVLTTLARVQLIQTIYYDTSYNRYSF